MPSDVVLPKEKCGAVAAVARLIAFGFEVPEGAESP
jgi:hypothetical protein